MASSLRTLSVMLLAGSLFFGTAFAQIQAQQGRPISGVIAATDKPIAISYVNEAGENIGRIAGVGEPIYLNDEISTPDGASLQVLLRDQTVFSIGPNSTLVFDEFIFDPTSADEVALSASVTKGTFKFISGKISKLKPGAMTLKLPNATASVRGTSVVGRVDDTGASDIVLLTGAVQLEAGGAPVVDLVQPGWGVSIGETGTASAPTPFAAEEINDIIKQVELGEEEGEGTPEQAGAEGAGEEEPSEEAVESVAEVVREAGEEVSVEEITEIIQKAEGNPEAVAEAIVKVIISNKIETGEISQEEFAEFEAFVTRQQTGDGEGGGLFAPDDFNPDDFKIEDLNIAELKVEDLGIEGFDFGGDDSFVEVFSQRLDTEVLALPKFDQADFGFDGAQFDEVKFDFASFDQKEISVTQTFDIKEVSQLIVGDQFGGADAPEIELSFFDILFNAESINQEVTRRETAFSFDQGGNFDNKEEASNQEQASSGFDEGAGAEQQGGGDEGVSAPTLFFATELDENGVAKTVIQRPVFDDGKSDDGSESAANGGQVETDAPATEVQVPSFDKADTLLDQLFEQETDAKTDTPSYDVAYDEKNDEKANQEQFLKFFEQLQKEAVEGTIDPLEYYVAGRSSAQWLTLQSDGSLGNSASAAANYDGMISQTYAGTARFRDSFSVKDDQTEFAANASYDVTLDYGAASVSGSFALSGMSLSGQTYFGADGETSQSVSFSERGLAGRDTIDGGFSAGDSAQEVNVATLDFHDTTDSATYTSRITTDLDMSVGSTVAINAALDGTLGEFTVDATEYSCNPSCSSTPSGGVGRGVSKVAAE